MRLLILLVFCSLTVTGQTRKPVGYQLELGSYLPVQGEIPFWQRANEYGIVPRTASAYVDPVETFRGRIRVDYYGPPQTKLDSLRAVRRRVDWGWGLSAVVNSAALNRDVRVLLPEAYAKVRYRGVELYAGRRRELVGLVDSTVSSGSYIWSGNALPPLKVQVGTDGWRPLGKLLSINAFYAQGWFEYDRFIKGSMLHQKALYLRLGKPTWRVWFYGGMNHQVQWGGNNETLPGQFIRNSQLPASAHDYVDIVLGNSLGNRQVDTTKYSAFDAGNRIGNHLGTVDLGMTIRAHSFDLFLYRQNIYEDGSLFYLINIEDGLNGLKIQNQRLRKRGFRLDKVVLEFLNTYSQGGDVFIENDGSKRGRDNYFNHGQYRDGWTSFGRTIGTPFIAPASDFPATYPGAFFTNNNRVHVYHIGLAGSLASQIGFTGKFSYSQNAGTYDTPFPAVATQLSGFLGLTAQLNWLGGSVLTTTVAYDKGDLYPQNLGTFISLKKQGLIKSRFTR
ncbi:capsule assembly Wzi family protein [Fibrella arboris]|uniref:capsule assembly Wzi family protein n=1 Tax=Fibrella arboris TaxID=3242486 RepID=UPI0035210E88